MFNLNITVWEMLCEAWGKGTLRGQLITMGPYFGGSAAAAVINFPLWKAAAIGQSGFNEAAGSFTGRMKLIFGPPYKGVAATIFGMTWARAAIFYFSDAGKVQLHEWGANSAICTTLPPCAVSAAVQVINQPIVRGTVMLQDPASTQTNVASQLYHLYRTKGARALWHGTTPSILKTAPKYMVAIWVKDFVASILPPPSAAPGEPGHRNQVLSRSAIKSVSAGVAGAALTNPLDVVRNEMFKTEEGFRTTVARLKAEEGYRFCFRGMQRNMVAVAAPIGMTIFLTDWLTEMAADNGRN